MARPFFFPIRLPGIGAGGLVLLCLVVRLVALDADPPSWLSWSSGLYTDEGYYTLDARSGALFGTAAPGNFHDRLLSPLLSLLQQGVFTVFGTGLLQARLLSVSFGLLTVVLFRLGLRRVYDVRTADLGALFLGLAPTFVFYNRLALQETPTVFWLVLAFALWTYGRFASGAALVVAVVFKSLAVIALPVLLIATPDPTNGGAGRGNSAKSMTFLAPPLVGAGGILLLYMVFWYWPHQAELARMAAYYRVHQMQPHSVLSLWLNVRRGLIGGERGVLPYLFTFLPVPCVLAGWKLGKRHLWTQADSYLAVWLVCGLVFCLVSSYAPSRYYVLFLPPLAGLAARCLVERKRSVQIAAIFAFCLVSFAWYGLAWAGQTETRRDASRHLVHLLPPQSVMAGEFAPVLCLDTPFAAAPVQPGLSNDDHPVERLQATSVAVTQTEFWQRWWQSRYPGIIQPSHKIATFTLGGSRHFVVDVYAVKSAGK